MCHVWSPSQNRHALWTWSRSVFGQKQTSRTISKEGNKPSSPKGPIEATFQFDENIARERGGEEAHLVNRTLGFLIITDKDHARLSVPFVRWFKSSCVLVLLHSIQTQTGQAVTLRMTFSFEMKFPKKIFLIY